MSFRQKVRELVAADPGLPHPEPTAAFWQQPMHETVGNHQSLSLPTETDVVVIGSGVTKALLEDNTAFATAHVTVLEARTLVSGATGRNGGHCVSAAGHKFASWVDAYGAETAAAIARFSLRNMERVQAVAGGMSDKIRNRSEIRRVEKLCYTRDATLWRAIQNSVALFAQHVPEHADHNRLVGAAELAANWGVVVDENDKDSVGGYVQPAGALWPYRFCAEVFAELLQRHGARRLAIETHTPVTAVDKNDTGDYIVYTPRGTIRARRVVYCTNGYTAHLLPRLRGKLYPFRGHMSTQAMPTRFPSWGATRSWSVMQPVRLEAATATTRTGGMFHFGLYYLQQNATTRDMFVGVEHQRVDECLCADDSFVSSTTLQDLPTCLPRFFRVLNDGGDGVDGNKETDDFPQPRLKSIWSGVMGMTSDGLPLVGRLPMAVTGRADDAGDGEEWIAAGFQGYGMDKCWLTGEALVAMMAGRSVSDWFPSAYLVTEERLASALSTEATAEVYVKMAEAAGDRSR